MPFPLATHRCICLMSNTHESSTDFCLRLLFYSFFFLAFLPSIQLQCAKSNPFRVGGQGQRKSKTFTYVSRRLFAHLFTICFYFLVFIYHIYIFCLFDDGEFCQWQTVYRQWKTSLYRCLCHLICRARHKQENNSSNEKKLRNIDCMQN